MNIERKRNGAGVDGGEPVIKKANFCNPLNGSLPLHTALANGVSYEWLAVA